MSMEKIVNLIKYAAPPAIWCLARIDVRTHIKSQGGQTPNKLGVCEALSSANCVSAQTRWFGIRLPKKQECKIEFCCLVIHLSITWTQYISTTCPTHLFTPYTCCHSPDHTHLHLVTCLHALYIYIYIPQLHTLLALLLASPCIFVPLFSDNLGFCVFLVTFVFSA